MAISVLVKRTDNFNTGIMVLADVTLDSSYPTGGYAVTPAQLGLSQIDLVIAGNPDVGGIASSFVTVAAANKLKMWQTTTGANQILVEVANAQDVSTSIVPIMAWGI